MPNTVSQCHKSKSSYGPDTKTCQKPYKFDIEIKVQGRIGIMNLRDTCLMVIHPIVKHGKPMSNNRKVMGGTQICTDRRTDGQTDGQGLQQYTQVFFRKCGYN